jgi:hypothetical protein
MNSSSNSPDAELISALYDAIEEHPGAIEPRKVLMYHYMDCGLLDAALDAAHEMLQVDPSDSDAVACVKCLAVRPKKDRPSSGSQPRVSNTSTKKPAKTAKTTKNVKNVKNAWDMEPAKPVNSVKPVSDASISSSGMDPVQNELFTGYSQLRERAAKLLLETRLIQKIQIEHGMASVEQRHLEDLELIADGKVSAVVAVPPPCSVRALARVMDADSENAMRIATEDLVNVTRWLRSTAVRSGNLDSDELRAVIIRRVSALRAALPQALQNAATEALMHLEHEELGRSYFNSETMYGEDVKDIPRSNFWVSEDGYAWDMDELVQAIKAGNGVMRNPLTKLMFTPGDVRSVLQHPLGKTLGQLELAQNELLERGVRASTIQRLESLSATFLADQSLDQRESREAMDEWLAYAATLPTAEQNVLDSLRVPATDSHTGQPYDLSVSEAVQDAKANRVCLHKTGDFIGQAAKYLRSSR